VKSLLGSSGIIRGKMSKRPFIYLREIEMKTKVWTRPDFEEVSLGCEINCYAPAE
jgi:coenzyme PQQ precursor peptide PqqA